MAYRQTRFVVLVLLQLALPEVARAWDFTEHRYIGESSFEAACRRLENKYRIDVPMLARLELACGPRDVHGKPRTRAQLYGQATAVAGDHLSSPDEFLSNTAPELVHSFFKYVGLALENESHFVPSAPRNWRTFHLKGEQLAVGCRARDLEGLTLQAEFEHAFYNQAFGDHFLQDSFSAGHSGFARVASRPSVAGAMHDKFNAIGRRLQDGRGEIWYAFGDGRLRDVRNGANLRRILAAAEQSVSTFLEAYLTGEVQDRGDLEIYARFPNAASGESDCEDLKPTDRDAVKCNDSLPLAISIQDGARVDESAALEMISVADRWHPDTNLTGAAVAFGTGPARTSLGFYFGLTDVAGADLATLGVGTGLDVPLYAKFPYPLALELGLRLLLTGTNADESRDYKGDWRLTGIGGLRISADVGKAWAFAVAPSLCYSWASTEAWRGTAFCAMFSVDHVLGTSGGGHR